MKASHGSVHASRAVALLLAVIAGCSGGAKRTGQTFVCDGADRSAICIQNCNLGCNANGCARTDIAQNEIVILQFSEAIDPHSVTPSSIRFRTATGDQPIGEFLVNGDTVEFVPTIETSGGQTFFGFGAGETYTLTIPGGANQNSVVRSTSGKPFAKTMTCTMVSSLGIIDLNGVPPAATLISPGPVRIDSAPRDLDIVLEFNEMIDATPFLGGAQGPVTFHVRRNKPAEGGGYECNLASPRQLIAGTPFLTFDAARSVSVLTFRPTAPLPGNVCVEIDVTAGVQDLSGKPAQPQTFSFRTEIVPLVEHQRVEEFDQTDFFDEDSSAGTWGTGVATFSPIGGTGEHGAFSLTMCGDPTTVGSVQIYTMPAVVTIPASNTFSGNPIAVTNGRLAFTSMVLPANTRLRFASGPNGWTNPPIITVAGRLDIAGEIDVSGASNTTYIVVAGNSTEPQGGQPGAVGGPFGGAGGRGGNKNITGATTNAFDPAYNGVDGQSARMLAGHGYVASTAASGGRGSMVFPASGLNTALIAAGSPAFVLSAAAGGGGGGLLTPGGIGQVLANTPSTPAAMGPNTAGGTAVQLFPFPASSGLITRASEHFLVGGGGGGGGASQATLSLLFPTQPTLTVWAPGCGGGGGGGAIALRAGGSFRLAATGKLTSKGGSAASTTSGPAALGVAAPAGGGSGGSIVLQSGGAIEIDGTLDVRGGAGGFFNRSGGGVNVQIRGGDGAAGFVRLETPTPPSPSLLAGMQPTATADNLGVLGERDDFVAIRSKVYSTGELFGPAYARYEIFATVGGVPMIFSDDPTVSLQKAILGAPVLAKFQCVQIDLATQQVTQTGPWRDGVATDLTQQGIATEGFNAFRFALLADTTFSPITIERVVVVYRI